MTGAGVSKRSQLIAFRAASGNPSLNIVSTFDSALFGAVLCISPLTCRAKPLCSRVDQTFAFCCSHSHLGPSAPAKGLGEVDSSWLISTRGYAYGG